VTPFAELLLRHRVAAGTSQRELARRSGLSERALRDLERGATTRPRRHSVRAVAAALKLTDHELAAFVSTATDEPAPAPPVEHCPAAELVGREADLLATASG
jgi:transcriptional regulator with XRE-family HTH domain